MVDFLDEDDDLYVALVCTMIAATTLLNLHDELSERCTKTQSAGELAYLCLCGRHLLMHPLSILYDFRRLGHHCKNKP